MRLAAFHQGVCFFGLANGEAMGHEFLRRHAAFGDETEKGLHVALLGPAHVGQRIILSGLLVIGIATSGSVGHGQFQFQFALVERLSINRHADEAHDDDAPFHAADFRGRVDGLARFGGCRHDHRVGAITAGEARDHLRQRLGHGHVGAEIARERDALAVGVKADDLASVGLQNLNCQQANQAKSHHNDAFAERGRRQSHALQRDGAQRDEARVLVVDFARDRNGEVARHGVEFRVVRDAGAGAGDAVADGQSHGVPTHGEHVADEAITKRDRRIELGENLLQRRLQPVALNIRDHPAHEVGPRHGLADQRGLRQLHQLALRARADQ